MEATFHHYITWKLKTTEYPGGWKLELQCIYNMQSTYMASVQLRNENLGHYCRFSNRIFRGFGVIPDPCAPLVI
jgi:hypothetical protein